MSGKSRITRMSEALTGSNEMTIFVIVAVLLLCGLAWLFNSRPQQPSILSVDRKTYQEMRDRSLIDSDTQDSWIKYCNTKLMEQEDGSFKRASSVCSCTYGAIAQAALAENKSFASILGEIANGKRDSLECAFSD